MSAQIDDIEAYIAEQGSPERALAFATRLLARCHRIGDVPFGGRPRDDLQPGIRSVPFEGAATIFYRLIEHEVLIVAVLSRGRDQAAYFGASS